MTYIELKAKQQQAIEKFPKFFAFDDQQFIEGLKKLDAKESEIISIYGGGFIIKKDKRKLLDLVSRHNKEMQYYINNDKDGNGFIKDMFFCELINHEYCVSYELKPTLNALGITLEEVEDNLALTNGLTLALEDERVTAML